MRITGRQLRQIIKEEVERMIDESEGAPGGAPKDTYNILKRDMKFKEHYNALHASLTDALGDFKMDNMRLFDAICAAAAGRSNDPEVKKFLSNYLARMSSSNPVGERVQLIIYMFLMSDRPELVGQQMSVDVDSSLNVIVNGQELEGGFMNTKPPIIDITEMYASIMAARS